MATGTAARRSRVSEEARASFSPLRDAPSGMSTRLLEAHTVTFEIDDGDRLPNDHTNSRSAE